MARRRKVRKKDTKAAVLFVVLVILLIARFAPGVLLLAIAIGIAVLGGFIWWKIYQYQRLKKSGIKEIDKMDGHQFEKYLGVLFKELGYKSVVTRASGDYGADLVIEKDGRKVVVQAKRYSGNVGLKAVQEVHTAITFYHADEGWVVSNQDFTEQAKRLARTSGVRLLGREDLIRMSLQVQSKKKESLPVPTES